MTSDELKAITADKVVDARGTARPGPLLAAKKQWVKSLADKLWK